MMTGRVVSVDVVVAGVDVLVAAPAGALSVTGVDALDLDVSGGVLELPGGEVVDYAAADYESDVVTFAAGLPVALEAMERLLVRPRRSRTQATVELSDGGEVIPVRVPHEMQSSVPVGVREDPELVTVEVRDDGSFWIYDVHDRPPLEVWGDPEGSAAEMSDDGLSFYTLGPSGRYEATRLGSGQDRLGVFNADGQIVGGVTADGQVVGQSGAIAGDFSVGGIPLMGRLWDNSPGAPSGWFERFSAGSPASRKFSEIKPSPSTSFPTGEEWGYAKLGVTARAGRAYRITVVMQVQPTTSGGAARTGVRYTSDSTEPTVTSTPLTWVTVHSPYVGGTLMTTTLIGSVAFAQDTDLRVLCTVQGLGGLEPRVSGAEFFVDDMGPQGTYGGGTYTTGREATPPPTVREYVSTWTATDFRVYDGTGQPDTSVTQPTQWGWADDPTDRIYTAITFTGGAVTGEGTGETITDATDGATLTRAEIFLANTSWLGQDSGTPMIGKGGYAGLPPTLTAPQATIQPAAWPAGAGQWVQVPVSWFTDTNRVITLGDIDDPTNFGTFMAHTDAFPPQVRLTYTR